MKIWLSQNQESQIVRITKENYAWPDDSRHHEKIHGNYATSRGARLILHSIMEHVVTFLGIKIIIKEGRSILLGV